MLSHVPDPPTARYDTGRLRRVVVAVAITLTWSVAALGPADTATAARVIHVSPAGDDGGAGTEAQPYRTVTRAVRAASPGDTIELAEGRYHESVQVYAKRVHLRAAPGADVVFDGARPVTGWSASGGDWWATWNVEFPRTGSPFTTAARPEAGWHEQFFLDGEPLREVASRDAVVPGAFFHDRAADRVWIGDDPHGHRVDGSDLPWGIYLNHAHGSTLTGLRVERYATPSSNMAAVRAYADDVAVTDVTVADNAFKGISAIGDRIDLVRVTAVDNGHLGIHAHQSTDLRVVDAVIERNNREGFDDEHAAGGLKVTTTHGLLISGARVVDNGGPGLWTDLDVRDAVIRSNVVSGSARSGIELELSHGLTVVDNTVTGSGEAGIWVLESTDAQLWHNALYGNVRDVWVLDGPRGDVVDIGVVNNTFGGGAAGAPAVLNVDDWTSQRSAASMRVDAGSNRYWLRPGSPTGYVSRWADWPYPLRLSSDIAQHRAATGEGDGSDLVVAAANPFVRSSSDARQPAGAPLGRALTARVAAALGVPAGAAHPAGPLGDADSTTNPSTPTTTVPGTTTPPTTPTTPTTIATTTPTTSTTVPGAGGTGSVSPPPAGRAVSAGVAVTRRADRLSAAQLVGLDGAALEAWLVEHGGVGSASAWDGFVVVAVAAR